MDMDRTSFKVDWYALGDGYAHKRLSFPKSAHISFDDLVPDSPLSLCFSLVDGPRSYSFVDTPSETARGWSNSAPPSPLFPPPAPFPMTERYPEPCQESTADWRTLATPGILSVADDCAVCGVDVDVSCLYALDEQLLLSPIECFSDLCWTSAVHDEVSAPATHRSTRSRAHSFKCAPTPPAAKDYSDSFECLRPLDARIALPLDSDVVPRYIGPPAAVICPKEKPAAYVADADDLLVQASRRCKKRDQTPTPHSAPTSPSRSGHTFRVISDAYSAWTRARKKSPA